MKRLALVVSVLGLTSIAHAADLPRKAAVPSASSWEGWYLGLHTGAALGISKVSDPYGSSIFGDSVRTPGFPPRRPDRLQLTTARQQMGLWRRSRRQLDRRRRHQYLLRSQRPADLLQLPRQSGFHRHVHRTHRLCRRCRRSHTALCERRRRRAAQQARRDDELRLRRLPDQHDVRKPDHVGMDRRRRCRAGGVAGVVGQARIWLPEFRQRKPQHPGDVFDDARRAPRRLRWRIRSSSAPASVPSANWNRRAQGVPWRFFGCRPPL